MGAVRRSTTARTSAEQGEALNYLMMILAASASAMAMASPTSDEFKACHRQASAALSACLDQQPGYENAECWSHARGVNSDCYRRVAESYRRTPEKEAAARRAREAAKQ